jgi:hypothetical protein
MPAPTTMADLPHITLVTARSLLSSMFLMLG